MAEGRLLAKPSEISPRELERCFNNFEANFRFSNVGYLPRATNLAMAEYHGEDINRAVTDRRRLTAADIGAEADRLFNNTPYVSLAYAAE